MSLKIVTDSACDLPRDIIDELEILTIPLNLITSEDEYRDKETIMPSELYNKMRSGIEFTTSQSTPELVYERFEKELDKGNDLLYICFSSGLSGQYQMAKMIVDDLKDRYKDREIYIIDSKAACTGMGLMVKYAGEMQRDGKTAEEIISAVEYYSKNINHIILIDDMQYLYKGGRITTAQVVTGGLLNIKPIITMDTEGKLKFTEKARGRKKLLKKTEELILEYNCGDISNQVVGIVYGDNREMAEEIRELLMEKFQPKEIIIENIGPTIAVHTGPDVIGITFLNKKL